MRRKISRVTLAAAACFALAAPAARAQTAKSPPVSFKAETLQDGDYVVRVENLSPSAMTAGVVVATATLPDGHVLDRPVRDFDSVLFAPVQRSVGRDEVYTFVVWGPGGFRRADGTPVAVQRQAELKAAIFEDGTTWGDPTWIARLLGSRAEDLRFTEWLLREAKNARSSNVPANDLIASAKAEKLRRSAAAPAMLEKINLDILYRNLSLNLQNCLRGSSMPDKNDRCLGQSIMWLMARQGRLSRSRPPLKSGADGAQ